MDKNAKIYVTQHWDMIGAGIVDALRRKSYENIILRDEADLDMTSESQVKAFFDEERPEYVFCFAGPHGGITANIAYPADLMYTNLRIQSNIIHNCYTHGVKKMLFIASSCVYPKAAKQPVREDYFLDGKMEPTSEAYSTARVAGVVMCGAYNHQYGTRFIPAVLTNYYGIGDDFTENGHVLASVLHKMSLAKHEGTDLTLWGDGTPRRQFMYIDDIADGAVLIMECYEDTDLINIAGGEELSIRDLAEHLEAIVGFEGKIIFDITKPNGTLRKLLDNSKLRSLGFKENIGIREGLKRVYDYYINEYC